MYLRSGIRCSHSQGRGACTRHDAVDAACTNSQYTCGTELLSPYHILESVVYCIDAPCAAPVESMSLVDCRNSTSNICGVEQQSHDGVKQQGCSGSKIRDWEGYPVCDSWTRGTGTRGPAYPCVQSEGTKQEDSAGSETQSTWKEEAGCLLSLAAETLMIEFSVWF